MILFCFCYVFAFHSPSPHNVPVAVVGSSQAAADFASELETGSKGVLAVTLEPSLESAQTDVSSGEIAAAYIPAASASAPAGRGTPTAELVVASAAQYQLSVLGASTSPPSLQPRAPPSACKT